MLTAFVLGGGGVLGAVEVGMLRALFERDIVPDLVLGTSVGALNGAMVARDPSVGVIDRLTDLWATTARVRATDGSELFRDRPLRTVRRVVATGGTHVFSAQPLRERLVDEFGDLTFEDLPVTFGVCAASIERAAEHWFTSGPLVPAILASAAVPGLLPPAVATTEFGEEHFLDGGIVNSIPVGRAVGAGRHPDLRAPGRPHRPAARRRRGGRGRWPGSASRWLAATGSCASCPRSRTGSRRTCCPAAGTSSKDDSMLAFRDFDSVQRRIDATYDASKDYLDEHLAAR